MRLFPLSIVFVGLMLATVFVDATTIRSVKLDDLYSEADQVALVKVISGDSEHYDAGVFKVTVESAFKGTKVNEILYVGPYLGLAVGNEYVLFLKRGEGEKAKGSGGLSFGDIPSLSKIMYAGYAVLPAGYECVFDGHDVSERCDYSVQLNPQQIKLPDTIRTFPYGDADAVTNYKKWVRRSVFVGYLNGLAGR
jgi:hypothetical protein